MGHGKRLTGREGNPAFLLEHVGEVVTTEQIYEASGQQKQYGRRLRELRDEYGYLIQSYQDNPQLKPDEYLLVSPEPQPVVARDITPRKRLEILKRPGAGAVEPEEQREHHHSGRRAGL